MQKVSIPVTHIGRKIKTPSVFLDDSLHEIQSQINRRSHINDSSLILLDIKYYSLVLVFSSGRSIVLKDHSQVLTSYHKTTSETIKALLLITLSDIIVDSDSGILLGSFPYKKYNASDVYSNKNTLLQNINIEYNLDISNDDNYVDYLYYKSINSTSSTLLSSIQFQFDTIRNLQKSTSLEINFYDKILETSVEIPTDVTIPYITQFELFSNSNYSGAGSNFINIKLLFKIFELDANIPFIGIGKKYTGKNPIFKLHKSLINTTIASDIKTWMVKEIKKQDIVEYKHIPNLLFRIKIDLNIQRQTPYYLVISLNQKASITISLEMDLKKMSGSFASTLSSVYLRDINYSQIITIINQLVERINKMPVFSSTLRIPFVTQDSLEIKQYSTQYYTHKRINKRLLDEFLQLLPRNKLFQINNVSSNIVSFVYKPVYMEVDTNNIVVNIYDNKNVLDSSVVQINQTPSKDMAFNILKTIYIIGELTKRNVNKIFNTGGDDGIWSVDDTNSQKLYIQKDIKEIRSLGGITDSRHCQKNRSPVIYKQKDDLQLKTNIPDSYLKYNNLEYICKKDGYPYIGFTSKGVVCCFKKSDQKHKPIYKQMIQTNSNTIQDTSKIIVKPSNILVNIKLPNGSTFKTFALKQIVGTNNGYYYINNSGIYTQITDSSVLQQLQLSDINMWLSEISLDNLLIEPSSTHCTNPPKFDEYTNKIVQETLDVNARCSSPFNIFKYTNNGYPCCSNGTSNFGTGNGSERKDYIKKSQHILTEGTKGYLSKESLLGKFLQFTSPERTFIRIGIKQDTDKLFNAIRLGTRIFPNGKPIISGSEIRQMLARYLEQNQQIFLNLNKGTLSSEYTLLNYIQYIMNNTIDTNPSLLLDLICEYFNTIVLLYDMDQNYILCTPNIKFGIAKKDAIILLRYTNNITSSINYEVFAEETNNGNITKFTIDDPIIHQLLSYYKVSCKQIIDNPTSNEFKRPNTLSKVLKVLSLSNIPVLKQVTNAFNQVYIISTKIGLIPVEPTFTLKDIPIISTIDLVSNTQMIYSKLKQHVESTRTILENNGLTSYNLHSKILGKFGVVGIMTNVGTIIPVNTILQEKDTSITELPTSTFNWYQGQEELALYNNQPLQDNSVVFYNSLVTFKGILQNIRKEFVKYKDELYSKIGEYKSILEGHTDVFDKLKSICTLIEPILEKIFSTGTLNQNTRTFIKELIAQEILQDPLNMSLFYGILPDNNIHDNTVQLIELADIQKFMNEFKTPEPTVVI